MGTKGCGGGRRGSWCSSMFSGYMSIYRQKKWVGGAMRVGGAYPLGRASLPRGRLIASLMSTPSLLDCVCSKNDPREGFIPFDIPFLRNTKIGKKTTICTRPSVNRLVPKII